MLRVEEFPSASSPAAIATFLVNGNVDAEAEAQTQTDLSKLLVKKYQCIEY